MKKKNSTPTPHDATFRQFLSQPDVARDFMELHLPATLRAICDLSTLKLESGSFVEDDLRPYFSDVLYSLKTTSGDDSYVHVLIEHQSTPDRHMAFRLLRYAVAAMKRHLDAGHKTLPLVLPLLFYAGKRSPYPFSTRWLDAFSDPTLAEKVYGNPFPLVDVTVIPDDEIAEHRSMAALTLLQKHIHQRDLSEVMDRLASVLLAGWLSSSQIISLVHYIVQAGETTDASAFVRELAQRIPQQEDALMTIAEQLRQEGRKQGKL
ncbi:Rpn family recombination-promoting nuclease/putative transposase, partial [Pantoea latae]|uniref:Rpn family recombination-promoting nuclease/putative transposase n=1 Tax=Pantoea latae TaxID=1964541 RepID=UPI00117EECDF